MGTTPFAVVGSLQLPGDSGLPPDPIPINFSSQFSSEADAVLNISGPGTTTIPFGTVPGTGCKGFLIKMDPSTDTTAAYVKVNGSSTGQLEITPGGLILYCNPTPAAGITALTVTTTTACVLRVWVLG